MFIVGHTLIWHSQLSPFVNNIKNGDSLLLFITNHINTVAGRYAGKVNSWDVVNEALNRDGSLRIFFWRNWEKTIYAKHLNWLQKQRPIQNYITMITILNNLKKELV